MEGKAHGDSDPTQILRRSIEHDRVHSAYLLTGTGPLPITTAREFARALVCSSGQSVACEDCLSCHRSRDAGDDEGGEKITIDAKGKHGPTYRHIGDHPDLLWVERGESDTRITIGQIRDLQSALRLGANEGGRRVAVIAGAEWLNGNAQNGLLRLLEEPPPRTTLVLVASRASAIIATIRSRSVRLRFPVESGPGLRDADTSDEVREIVETLDHLHERPLGELLDFAEQYRGARATAAESVRGLIDVSAEWLCDAVKTRIARGESATTRELDAHRGLQQLRRDLVQRNANPQMVAERLLLGLRDVVA